MVSLTTEVPSRWRTVSPSRSAPGDWLPPGQSTQKAPPQPRTRAPPSRSESRSPCLGSRNSLPHISQFTFLYRKKQNLSQKLGSSSRIPSSVGLAGVQPPFLQAEAAPFSDQGSGAGTAVPSAHLPHQGFQTQRGNSSRHLRLSPGGCLLQYR